MQFDDKPSNFSGAHAATARHCAPHTARWSLRRHRRSLAALPAGRGPPPLLVLPPLPPRDSAALRGRAERSRRRRRPVQIARVVFSCGARWQQTRLGILNSAGEQPAGCAAAGQQLLGPNTAGPPAARELEPPGGAAALPATIAATTRNAWWWGCRWWCAVRAPPRGEEQLSQPRAHRPGGARTRAGGRGGRAREGTSRTAATGARSRWGQWRDTERRRKRQ